MLLSIYDVIVVQKSSNGDGKFTFYGWGIYFHHTLSANIPYISAPTSKERGGSGGKQMGEGVGGGDIG